MNLDISKLSIDELKTFKKFNREFLPKIKKLDFNFADMKNKHLSISDKIADLEKLNHENYSEMKIFKNSFNENVAI